MAALFKPTRPYPLPTGAAVVRKGGKRHVRITERGKGVFYPLTEDGTKYLKPSAKWAADVKFADGKRKRVRFSANRDASAVMLADLLKRIEGERSGVRDRYADHQDTPLAQLLKEYEQHVLDTGATVKEATQAARRCELVFAGTGFALVRDLDPSAAERWLADRRRLAKKDGGFGPVTSNHYRKSLVAFGNWLVRARRTPENPFRFIPKVNAAVDVRHQRRPLSAEEFTRLLTAASSGGVFRGLAGVDRAALYTVAGMTGLRAQELASLTPRSFALDAETPVVVVEAAYSKHRRRDEVPLHPDLTGELRVWLAGKPDAKPLWPGNWAKHTAAVDLIKRDLEVARAAWIAEAQGLAEKGAREACDFLVYRDRDGRFADFHALRHTFVTNLVSAGVAPKDAKELARHSTITLTMDRYAHVGLRDTAAAVAKLTLPVAPTPARAPATGDELGAAPGAAGGAAEGGYERGRLRIIEESGVGGASTKPLKSQRKEGDQGESRTVEEVCPTGVEPVTFGFGVRWYGFTSLPGFPGDSRTSAFKYLKIRHVLKPSSVPHRPAPSRTSPGVLSRVLSRVLIGCTQRLLPSFPKSTAHLLAGRWASE